MNSALEIGLFASLVSVTSLHLLVDREIDRWSKSVEAYTEHEWWLLTWAATAPLPHAETGVQGTSENEVVADRLG